MFESLNLTLSDISHLMIGGRESNKKGTTMLKFVKKTKLAVRDGIVVNKKGKVKNIDPAVVALANELEELVQRKRHELNAKGCCCGCEQESEPEFELVREGKSFKVEVNTPALDDAVERSLAIIRDLDRVDGAKEMNKQLDHFRPLLKFADDDQVIVGFDHWGRLNTPVLGNIFDLTTDKVYDAIAFLCDGVVFDNEDDVEE